MTLSWSQIAMFLIAVTEDAIRLRSSSPFVGFLTEEEHLRIFETFRLDDAARLPANLDTSPKTIGYGC